eukprot:6707897-Heterocapsa_arctica.AAC.1
MPLTLTGPSTTSAVNGIIAEKTASTEALALLGHPFQQRVPPNVLEENVFLLGPRLVLRVAPVFARLEQRSDDMDLLL